MRFKLFAITAIVFLALVSMYQEHVRRDLSSNLRWLVERCVSTQ
jgi:hypothetical protein